MAAIAMGPGPSRSRSEIRTDHLRGLPAGAKVALIAPAGPPNPLLVIDAISQLRSLELEPIPYPSLTASHPRAAYLAGSDQARAEDLTWAWTDPEIEAVVCARGGYGCIRLLDLLDAHDLRRARPKPLLGSSDVTALHEWWAEELQLATWFTPMPATADGTDLIAREQFGLALRSGLVSRTHQGRGLTGGMASGPLIGGNLSLLAMNLGSRGRSGWRHDGAIVLLEDIAEETYKLDGYLVSLLRAGWFEGVAGVALGTWKDCHPDQAVALCLELLGPLGVPIVADLPFGHGPGGHTIALGALVSLDAGSGTLTQLTH